MSDLIKVVEVFVSYFLGKKNFFGEKSLEISAEILNQMRRVLILVLLSIGSLALFCMGMGHLIERSLNNIDNGQSFFTPSIWLLLGFQILCVGILLYATRKQIWLSIFKKDEVVASSTSSALPGTQIESVISLLILDFIKEREHKRDQHKPKSE